MITQTFTVTPQQYIQSGWASYSVDEQTGIIEATEDIIGGVLFFTKELKNSANAKIDPQYLLSKNLRVGMSLEIGSVSLKIKTIKNDVATLIISINDDEQNIHGSGPARLDLSREHWSIIDISVSGTLQIPVVGQINQTIELKPEV